MGNEIDTPRILLVEPDPACRQVFGEILVDHGAELMTVQSAEEALRALNGQETFGVQLVRDRLQSHAATSEVERHADRLGLSLDRLQLAAARVVA